MCGACKRGGWAREATVEDVEVMELAAVQEPACSGAHFGVLRCASGARVIEFRREVTNSGVEVSADYGGLLWGEVSQYL